MSYILDALKKIEQERKRSKTPDFMAEPDVWEDEPKRKLWLYALLVLVVAAAGSAGWFLGSKTDSSMTSTSQEHMYVAVKPPTQPQSATPPSATPSSDYVTTVPQAKITEQGARQKEAATRIVNHETAIKKIIAPVQVKKDSMTERASSTNDTSNSQAAPSAIDQSSVRTALPGHRIYAISELPDEIKQGLPTLSISTHIYSPEQSERLTSIDGHIGREGQEIMPGIVLESITPDGAILRYKGYKFKIILK